MMVQVLIILLYSQSYGRSWLDDWKISSHDFLYTFCYWFIAFIDVLFITQILSIIFPLKLICSQIAFFKYYVVTFSIDVVSILSNFKVLP